MFVDSLLQMQPLAGSRNCAPAQRDAGRRRHPGAAGERLRAAVGDDPFRRRGDACRSARSSRSGMIDFVPLDGNRMLVDPGVHRQRGAEPDHPHAARLFGGRTRADRQLPQRAFRRHARWPRSAPRWCANCATRAREMETLLSRTRSRLSEQALDTAGDDMVLAGQTRLMGLQGMSDMDRLRELFEAFARKREILAAARALHQGARRAGLHRRGKRPGAARTAALITAPYSQPRPGAGRAGRHRPDAGWPTTG